MKFNNEPSDKELIALLEPRTYDEGFSFTFEPFKVHTVSFTSPLRKRTDAEYAARAKVIREFREQSVIRISEIEYKQYGLPNLLTLQKIGVIQ